MQVVKHHLNKDFNLQIPFSMINKFFIDHREKNLLQINYQRTEKKINQNIVLTNF